MAELVYLEEELPEIEIREWVREGVEPGEEGQKKGINVHSAEELLFQFTRLLNSKSQGQVFQRLHQETIAETPFRFPGTLIPEIAIQRKDNGDEDVFFENYDNAMKIANYNARHKELKKAFFGLETIDEHAPTFTSSASETILADGQEYRVLPEDYLPATVTQLHDKHGVSPFHPDFLNLTLTDKITESTIYTNKSHPVPRGDSLGEVIDRVLAERSFVLKETTDLYDLWKQFMRHSIDLTYDTLKPVVDQLASKENDLYEYIKSVSDAVAKPIEFPEQSGGLGFYTVQEKLFQNIYPIFERLQTKLQDLYNTFLANTRNQEFTLDQLPHTAYEIAKDLSENKYTLEQAIQWLKLRILSYHQQAIQQWLEQVAKWDLDKVSDSIKDNLQRFSQTQYSKYDEPTHEWQLQEYLKTVKKGEVVVREAVGEEEAFVAGDVEEGDMMGGVFDPEDIPFYEEIEYTVNTESLDEGRKELFAVTFKLMTTLMQASGLPLDLQRMVSAVPVQMRKTRLVRIQEALPELSNELQLLLAAYPGVPAQVVEGMAMKQTLHDIYQDFLKDLGEQWMHLLAWWVCELQHAVLNRSLHFDLWKGASQCVPAWSPYGPPMEGLKVKKEGVLPYLICVMRDLIGLEGTAWNVYVSGIGEDFQTQLFKHMDPDTIARLQAAYKTFDKDLPLKTLQAKGESIKTALLTTVKNRDKAKYLTEYMRFLKNLPSVLVQSSISKRLYSGCCLQLLSEKFRSDYDWAAYVKDAYKLKKLFATQRTGIEKRPVLAGRLEKVVYPVVKPVTYATDVAALEPWTVEQWKTQIETYMPFQDYQAFLRGIQNLAPITERYNSLYIKATKDTTLVPFVQNATLQTLNEFYRKLLQVQYKLQTSPSDFLLYSHLYTLLTQSDAFVEDVQELQRIRLLQYFIARQLCFPAKPEFAQANSLIGTGPFLVDVHVEMKKWVEQKRLPETTNFKDYINKIRETENFTKLKLIDRMTPEERKLYMDAKKLGIAELGEYLESFEEGAESEAESEFLDYGENNEEMDEDSFYDTEY